MTKPVGFIGLGMMGGPMALRLADAGYPLTVCDVRRESVAAFTAMWADLRRPDLIDVEPDEPLQFLVVVGSVGAEPDRPQGIACQLPDGGGRGRLSIEEPRDQSVGLPGMEFERLRDQLHLAAREVVIERADGRSAPLHSAGAGNPATCYG